MASLREWTALTLSALLFSVVAGYGVGRALNAKHDAPAPRPPAPSIAIVDRTGEPLSAVGDLSASELAMPPVFAPSEVAEAPAPLAQQPVSPPSPPPVHAPAPLPLAATSPAAPLPTPTPVAAIQPGERASLLFSFTDQRLYLMAGDRPLASYRVKFGFDVSRVKPGETRVSAKPQGGKMIELGWKSFPVTSGGDRGFILAPEDFDSVLARVGVGAVVTTTRERVSGAAGGPRATHAGAPGPRVIPVATPIESPPLRRETPAADAEQPAFLAAAPRGR